MVKGYGSKNEYIFRQIELNIPEAWRPNLKHSPDVECGDVRGAVIATMQKFALENDDDSTSEPAHGFVPQPAPELESSTMVSEAAEEKKRILERIKDKIKEKRESAIEGEDLPSSGKKTSTSTTTYTYLISNPIPWESSHKNAVRVKCLDGIDRCADAARVIYRSEDTNNLTPQRIRIKKYLEQGDSARFIDYIYAYPGTVQAQATMGYGIHHVPFSISSYDGAPGLEFKIIASITTDLTHIDLTNDFQKFRGRNGLWYYEVEYDFLVTVQSFRDLRQRYEWERNLVVESLCYDKHINDVRISLDTPPAPIK